MDEHIELNEIERYLAGELTTPELLRFDRHIGECGKCRRAALNRADRAITAAVIERAFAARLQSHLTYDEIEGMVNEDLTGKALVRAEAHLESCFECRDEINDIREFARPRESAKPSPSFSPAGLLVRPGGLLVARLWVPAFVGAVLIFVFTIWFQGRGGKPSDLAVSTQAPWTDGTTDATPSPPEPAAASKSPEAKAETVPGSELATSLNDGGSVVGIDRSGNLVGFKGISERHSELLRSAFKSGSLTVGAEAIEVIPGSGKRMGGNAPEGGEDFRLDDPVGRIIDTGSPEFSWRPVEGAASYRVDVFDVNYQKVASSGDLRTTRWKTNLRRGRTYVWVVTALRGGIEIRSSQEPGTEARFRTLDDARSRNLALIRRNYPRSRLLLGVAYAEAGMIDDARRQFGMLSRENRNSPVPRKLLKELEKAAARQ